MTDRGRSLNPSQSKEKEVPALNDLLNEPNYLTQTSMHDQTSLEDALAFASQVTGSDIISSLDSNIEPKQEVIEPEIKPDAIEELIPSDFKNPIDFVNYMETVHIAKKLISYEKQFQLKNLTYAKSQLNLLQFIPKRILSAKLFKEGNPISSIATNGQLFYTGNRQGVIDRYTLDDEFQFKPLTHATIDAAKSKQVVCMDISKRKDYLMSGYSNGYLALWDIKASSCLKVITDIHKDCILAIRFIKAKGKVYEIISSDVEGFIYRITISEGFFDIGVNYVQLMKTRQPMFLIEILKTTKEEKKKYNFCKSKALVVTFGGLEHILVYQLDPELKKLFAFPRPSYFEVNSLPDICFGIGLPPRPLNVEEEDETDVDFDDVYLLLVISWECAVYVFIIPMLQEEALPVMFIGHYINSTTICRVGFLAPSIVYLFDKYKRIKLISTSSVTYGEVEIDPKTKAPISKVNSFNSPEIEEGIIQEGEILFQAIINEIGRDKEASSAKVSKYDIATKETYTNFIKSQPKTIILLGKSSFHLGKLSTWEECLSALQAKSNWHLAMKVGLDLYLDRISLPYLPFDSLERKLQIEENLKALINNYVTIHMKYEDWQFGDKYEETMINCISLCIEFCLEINQVALLLKDLQPSFISKGFGEVFLERLEPFILSGKFLSNPLDQGTLSKMIELYLKQKRYQTLAQVLLHLDIKSIDTVKIKEQCSSNCLISPLIYIYINGEEEDYFFPMFKIYAIFKSQKDISLNDFKSYREYLKANGLNQLEKIKPYIGHKLFWYINQCLKGEKYPGKEAISPDTLQDLVSKMTLWLLSYPVIDDLIKFDSFSFFSILTKLFSDPKLLSFIEKIAYKKENAVNLLINNIIITDFSIPTLIELISSHSLQYNNECILEDFYRFILKVSLKLPSMPNKLLFQSAKYMLSLRPRDAHSNEHEDYFGIHTYLCNFEETIQSISTDLNEIIDLREDFTEEELLELLGKSQISAFAMVTFHLLDKMKNYSDCLEILLTDTKKLNKIANPFDWLDTTFLALHSQDPPSYTKLQSKVIEKTVRLGSVSIDKLHALIEDWFDGNHDKVLKELQKNSQLLLQYLDKHLLTFKEDELGMENQKHYEALLSLHMDLLFSLKRYDQVLPNLQKRQLYPTEKVLEKCKDANLYEAALFLYQKIGATEEQMNYFTVILANTFDEIKYAVKNKKGYKELLEQHNTNLRRCIEICENNSKKSNEEESEAMWFKFLTLIYQTLNSFKKDPAVYPEADFEVITGILSLNIKEILDKMDSYVSIPKIIDNITDNYKQAEFKDFKNLLLDVLSSFSHTNNILLCTKTILSKTLQRHRLYFNGLASRGNFYSLNNCDECTDDFEALNKRTLLLFRCGHKIHGICCFKQQAAILCPVCKRIEDQSCFAIKGESFEKYAPSIIRQDSIRAMNESSNRLRRKVLDLLKNVDKKYYETSQVK